MILYTFLTPEDQKPRFRNKHLNVHRKYLCDAAGQVYSMNYQNSFTEYPKPLKPCTPPKALRGRGNCYMIAAGVLTVFSQEQIREKSDNLINSEYGETYNTDTKQWSSQRNTIKQEPVVEKDIPHCVIVCHKDHETKVACHVMCESRQKALDYCRDCSTNDHVYKIYKLVDVVTFEPQPSLMHVNPV
jgi:hypothetical protein